MAILKRVFRSWWVRLAAILLIGLPVFTLFLARTSEKYLASEHEVGGLTYHFHGAKVSAALKFRADSVAIRFPGGRSHATRLSLSLLDWEHPFSSRPIVRLISDSIDLVLTAGEKKGKTGPAKFPSLKFYLPVGIDWRILTVRPPGIPPIRVSRAQWRSSGLWGVQGRFTGDWAHDSSALNAEFEAKARWRGGNLRYRLSLRDGADSLLLTGIRDRADLSLGEDSLTAFLADPGARLPRRAPRPDLRRLRLSAKVDWRARKAEVSGRLRSEEFGILTPTRWNFLLRYSATGGELKIDGVGNRQSLALNGDWAMPEAWLKKPDWNRLTGHASGQVRGVRWTLGKWALPVDFEVNSVSLETGRKVRAILTSRDSTRVEAAWNGARPGRVEFAGTVSPRETWATIWTDTNVSFHSASVRGSWENKTLQAIARLRGVRGYRFVADSVETVQEVNSTGYTLRSARIFHQGEVFHGSGHVEWKTPKGRHHVSLVFEASHPEFGRIRVAMPDPAQLECTADGVHVYRFPYLPLAPVARYRPFVDGRFSWNLASGVGESDGRASFAFREKGLRWHVGASWDRDSLRVATVEMVTGSARFVGSTRIGLRGKSLAGLAKLRVSSLGPTRMEVGNLQLEDVFTLAGATTASLNGVVNGKLSFDPATGWDGMLETGVVRGKMFPGGMEISGATLRGIGDSVHFSAVTASKRQFLLNDTLEAGLAGFRSDTAHGSLLLRSGGFQTAFVGFLPRWKGLQGTLRSEGRLPLGVKAGTLEEVFLEGELALPFGKGALQSARFASRPFRVRYSAAIDTQWLSGTVTYGGGVMTSPDLLLRHSQGGEAQGRCEFRVAPVSLRAEFSGPEFRLVLPQGRRVIAQGLVGSLQWGVGKPFHLVAESRSGSFTWMKSPARLEGGFERVSVNLSIPTGQSMEMGKVEAKGRVKDFFFQRKLGFSDIQAFFRAFGAFKKKRGGPVRRHARPWDVNIAVEATGTRNRVDTDILRATLVGDLEVKGVYPYTLFRGKISGLQGEVGQPRQAFDVRDLEIKWENATLEEGTIYLEGDKKILAECGKPELKQTCNVMIKLDGRLDEMNFSYDSDCGANQGEPPVPTMLISSLTQGCYSRELQSGEGGYGGTVLNLLEPRLNENLTKGLKWASGGLIKSTQVSGLGSLVGGDTTGYEPVAIEVESKEKYRMSLKGKAGYHPEQKLANPWEYRLAAEYRPPLERWVSDSGWKAKVKNRFSLETSVETRPPETRDIEGQRQVSKQVGLRYRYRFWDWW